MSEIDGKLNERLARIQELKRRRKQNKSGDVPEVEVVSEVKSIPEPKAEDVNEKIEKPEAIAIGPNETVEVVALRIQQQELQRIEALASQSMSDQPLPKVSNKHNEDMKHDIQGYIRLAKLRTKQALAETLRYVESNREQS